MANFDTIVIEEKIITNETRVEEQNIEYQQIQVKPKGVMRSLKVTFDETSKNQHFWGYHRGSSFPHSSEAFHVERLQSGKIKIFGFALHPEEYRWYLTVHEDADGLVDLYPQFLPENVVENSNMFLHKEFTSMEQDGYISLSFQTIQNPHTVHLVTQWSRDGRIQTKSTDRPQYYFKNGPPVTKEALVS